MSIAVGIAVAGRIPEAGTGIDAGIGEGDVEAAKCGDMVVEHALEGGAVGNVEPGGAGFAPLPAQPRGLALGALAVNVGEGHFGAGLDHRLGIGKADARGGAGDDGRAALDVELVERLHLDPQ